MTSRGAWTRLALLTVALAGAGCSVQRTPVVTVGPSYSIMRDQIALETHMGGPGGGRGVAVAGADDRRPAW